MDFEAIEKAKQQWQTAVDLMPQLICLMNGEGRVIHISRTMEWWGLGSVASASGRELHDILHPGCNAPDCYFRSLWLGHTPARLAGKRVVHYAFDPILNRHFMIRIQPLARRGSDPTRLSEDLHTIVVVDDISDLKQIEVVLQQRNTELTNQMVHESERRILSEGIQRRLLAILEQTTDYIAMSDASESVLYLNPAGRRMLGLGPADDISQKKLCDHADPDVRHMIRNIAVPSAIENGLWTGESRLRDSSGREIHTSQVIIAHRGEDGQVDCLSTILRDISERVQSEQDLRESQEELLRLSSALITIQEDERRRIALDLHDGLGQSLSLIKLATESTAEKVAAGEADAALQLLHQITRSIREALTDVRRVATELRPSILDDLGILPTLSWFFREFEAMCGGHLSIEKVLDIAEEDVPVPLKITLYRVLQEATSNIVKHAQADRMRVSLYRTEHELHLLIEDNGCGFDQGCLACSHSNCRGLGLASMKERVSLSGGSFHLESSPYNGTRIQASWTLY